MYNFVYSLIDNINYYILWFTGYITIFYNNLFNKNNNKNTILQQQLNNINNEKVEIISFNDKKMEDVDYSNKIKEYLLLYIETKDKDSIEKSNLLSTYFKLKYKYKGKTYIFINNGIVPKFQKNFSSIQPRIVEAKMKYNNNSIDITNLIDQYQGPNYDFHDIIHISDLVGDVEFPYIEFKIMVNDIEDNITYEFYDLFGRTHVYKHSELNYLKYIFPS